MNSLIPSSRRHRCFCYIVGLSIACSFLNAASFDVAAQFESGWLGAMNPNGVWSYGYSAGFTTPLSLYTSTVQNGVNGPNAQYWLSPSVNIGTSPAAEYNNGPAYADGNISFLANEFLLVAGIGGQYSNAVFTAPAADTYSFVGSFRGAQNGIGTVVGISTNGTLIFNSAVTALGQIVPFSANVSLLAGQTLRFSVGPGGGLQNTGLAAQITSSPSSTVPDTSSTAVLLGSTILLMLIAGRRRFFAC